MDISRCFAATWDARFSAILNFFTRVKKLHKTRKHKLNKDLYNIYKVGGIPNLNFVFIFLIKRSWINLYLQISCGYCFWIRRHTAICFKMALCRFIQIHVNTVFYLFFQQRAFIAMNSIPCLNQGKLGFVVKSVKNGVIWNVRDLVQKRKCLFVNFALSF